MKAPEGYQPIKDAARMLGNKRLKGELASGGRKAVAWDFRGKGRLADVSRAAWEGSTAKKILKTGKVPPFPLALRECPVFVALLPGEKPLDLTRNKGGRPESVDWAAVETALASEIERFGYPSLQNPPGWQRPADVNRWAADLLQEHGEDASDSSIKMHVRQMLLRLKK